MTIENLSTELRLEMAKLIEYENAKIYRNFKIESDSVQSNYDMGLLTTEELINQQYDLLAYCKEGLVSIK